MTRFIAALLILAAPGCAAATDPDAIVASVSITPASASVAVGQTTQLSVVSRDAAGATISGKVPAWSSSALALATVSSAGVVTGVATGQATVTATIDGKSGTSLVTVTPPPSAFAGTYATRVTLTQNGCGTVNVADNPTVVAQITGSTAVTFTHAGQTYSGTVAADGSFTTTTKDVDVNDGFVYRIAITGKFTTNAFAADATVDRTGSSLPACRYVVHWAATK